MGNLIAHAAPAGGAALRDLVIAGTAGMLAMTLLAAVVALHRMQLVTVLDRSADFAARLLPGSPREVALPGLVLTGALYPYVV